MNLSNVRIPSVPGLCMVLACLLMIGPSVARAYQDPPLTEKTLVVWVAPASLDQRAGSALTLEDPSGNFDGIVFGELAPKRWMAGSEMFRRTLKEQSACPEETATPGTFVQLAAVYDRERITLFRNGELYASHSISQLQPFGNDRLVLFGPRHKGKEDIFSGSIDDARIYARALTKDELLKLKPNIEGPIRPWAWWSFNDAKGTDAIGRFPHAQRTSGAKLENGLLVLDGSGGFYAASNAALLRDAVRSQGNPDWQKPPAEEMQLAIHLMHPGGDSLPGDPNPAYFLDGVYHLHYIFAHPWKGQTSFSFAHVTSPDMLHWTWRPTTLQPGSTGHGMFSGTGFVTREGIPAAIYHGQASGKNQIALAKDRAISGWNSPFPIQAKNADGSDAQIPYWDPDCFQIGDTYYAISGGENPPLMKSKNLKDWTLVGPFMAHDMPDVAYGEDVSCPNFFPIGNKWMLLCISHPLGCRYYLGDWDAKKEQFVPTQHGRLNWRRDRQPTFGLFQRTDYFAPESVLTPDGRRVVWAWLTSLGANNEILNKTVQALPRELRLEGDALRMEPIRELETLRYDRQSQVDVVLDAPITGHTARVPPADPKFLRRVAKLPEGASEILIRIPREQAMRKLMGFILYSDGAGNGLPVMLRPETGTLRVGDAEAPFSLESLEPDEDVTLRIFVDNYLVEVFANGRQAIASAYFGDRSQLGVDAFTVGVPTALRSVELWKLKPTNQGFLEAIESRVWVPQTK